MPRLPCRHAIFNIHLLLVAAKLDAIKGLALRAHPCWSPENSWMLSEFPQQVSNRWSFPNRSATGGVPPPGKQHVKFRQEISNRWGSPSQVISLGRLQAAVLQTFEPDSQWGMTPPLAAGAR